MKNTRNKNASLSDTGILKASQGSIATKHHYVIRMANILNVMPHPVLAALLLFIGSCLRFLQPIQIEILIRYIFLCKIHITKIIFLHISLLHSKSYNKPNTRTLQYTENILWWLYLVTWANLWTKHSITLSELHVQGEHKVFPWLQTFITRKLREIQTYIFFYNFYHCVVKRNFLSWVTVWKKICLYST